jgi:predicted phosphoadenosine phosphosulfate sulfurtransferase
MESTNDIAAGGSEQDSRHRTAEGNFEFEGRELSAKKRPIGISVLDAARQRIANAFDSCERVYLSFSAGKDSTVMLHLVAQEARKRGRKFGVLLIDLEAQYTLTIEHATRMREMYLDITEWYWVCLPIGLRNAVSVFEPKWECWSPDKKKMWVRQPPSWAITDTKTWDWYVDGMEFEDFVPEFGAWYAQGKRCACFVGIRCDESLNRFRTIAYKNKTRLNNWQYTTLIVDEVYNFYPIYDWATSDDWVYQAKNPHLPYNKLYDMMHKAGLTIHQMRICEPYGDDQRRGLWLYQLIEPMTWGRVVARVQGANSGAMYVQETGNMTGYQSISLPPNHTWRSFTEMLLKTLPKKMSEHFQAKFDVYRKWWMDRGYEKGIPDFVDPALESKELAPSWRRMCKCILRNDYWCKTIGFSQHKTGSYERYLKLMEKRRQRPEWNADKREADARGELF